MQISSHEIIFPGYDVRAKSPVAREYGFAFVLNEGVKLRVVDALEALAGGRVKFVKPLYCGEEVGKDHKTRVWLSRHVVDNRLKETDVESSTPVVLEWHVRVLADGVIAENSVGISKNKGKCCDGSRSFHIMWSKLVSLHVSLGSLGTGARVSLSQYEALLGVHRLHYELGMRWHYEYEQVLLAVFSGVFSVFGMEVLASLCRENSVTRVDPGRLSDADKRLKCEDEESVGEFRGMKVHRASDMDYAMGAVFDGLLVPYVVKELVRNAVAVLFFMLLRQAQYRPVCERALGGVNGSCLKEANEFLEDYLNVSETCWLDAVYFDPLAYFEDWVVVDGAGQFSTEVLSIVAAVFIGGWGVFYLWTKGLEWVNMFLYQTSFVSKRVDEFRVVRSGYWKVLVLFGLVYWLNRRMNGV